VGGGKKNGGGGGGGGLGRSLQNPWDFFSSPEFRVCRLMGRHGVMTRTVYYTERTAVNYDSGE